MGYIIVAGFGILASLVMLGLNIYWFRTKHSRKALTWIVIQSILVICWTIAMITLIITGTDNEV